MKTNKMLIAILAIMFLVALILPSSAFAGDQDEIEQDVPLEIERFKIGHGDVVRKTYDESRRTCMNSNPHSRASSRSEVCVVEVKVNGQWVIQQDRPAVSRYIPTTGGCVCDDQGCTMYASPEPDPPTIGIDTDIDIRIPCTGACPPGG